MLYEEEETKAMELYFKTSFAKRVVSNFLSRFLRKRLKVDLLLSISELNVVINEKDALATMNLSAQMPKEDLEKLLKSINL